MRDAKGDGGLSHVFPGRQRIDYISGLVEGEFVMRANGLQVTAIVLLSSLLLMAPTAATATVPIVQYSYPASWDGVAPVVTDLSPAGNNGSVAGAPTLSAMVPPGADPASRSLATIGGGHRTDAIDLLDNAVLESAGGFVMELSFLWDGGDGGFSVQKIVDYAGTEFLQLETINLASGTADLHFGFNDSADGPSMGIMANTWYHVVATFDTQGNSLVGADIDGLATMVVNAGAPLSQAVTKTGFGDSLDRPVGFGIFSGSSSGIVKLSGLIHDPTISLLPEPTSLALLALGGIAVVRRRR